MVTCKLILDNLKKEDISSLLEDIQFLLKLTDVKVQYAEVLSIIKAIRHLLFLHEESSSPDSYTLKLKLAPSINLCVDYIRNNFTQDNLTSQVFLPILYHIIKAYLKSELYCPALSYAENCIKLLSNDEQNAEIDKNTYYKNLHGLFWNAAFRIEKLSEDSATAFKLRCKAMEFIVLSSHYSVAKGKILAVLSRYFQCNEGRDHTKVIDFLQCIWNILYRKKKDKDYTLYLFKLLYSWFNVFMKDFKHLLPHILSWLSELASHFEQGSDEPPKQSIFIKTCLEISRLSIQVFLLKEDERISNKTLLCFKKVLSNYSNDFEIDMLIYTCNFFCYSFMEAFQNFVLLTDEKDLYLVKTNMDFILLLAIHYFKISSDEKSQKYLIISMDLDLVFSDNLVKIFASLLKNAKSKKIQAHIKEIQKFITFSACKFKLSEPTHEMKKKISYYAMSIGNVGTILYNSSLYLESMWFLESSCEFLSAYGAYDEDMFKEFIWRKKEISVYCFYQSGSHEKALQNVVQLLLEDSGKKDECMKLWRRVKKDALKRNNMNVTSRTISDVLRELNTSISPEDEVALLCEELKYARNEKFFFVEEIVAAANQIFSLASHGIKRAFALLEIVDLSPSIGERVTVIPNKSLLEMCLESITLYKEYVSENPTDIEAKLQLSVNYFWLYRLKQKKLHEVAEKEAEECLRISPEEERNFLIEENELCDIKPTFPLVTYLVEVETINSLELALEIWLEIFNNINCSQSYLADKLLEWNFFMIMNTTAEIFSTSAQNVNELKSWILLRSIAASVGNKAYEITASISLINFFVEFGYLQVAEELLKKVECDSFDFFLNCNSDDFEVLLLKFNLQLAKSYYCLLSGKFDEGLIIVRDILGNPIIEKSSKPVKIVLAETLLLQSKFLLVPPSAFADAENVDYFRVHTAISSSTEGVTVVRGILKKSAETEKFYAFNDWMPFKTVLLRSILKGFLQLSEQYFNVGDPRYARCFLREALKLAESHVLTYWSSKILLLLGRIDILCDYPNDCLVKLNGLKYIMDENSKENASLQLSRVYNEIKISEASDPAEEFLIPSPSKINFGRDVKQNFLNNSDVLSSPVSDSRKQVFEFEFQLKTDSIHKFPIWLINLEIWALGCSHLVTLEKESQAEKQLKKLLVSCEILKKSDPISNVSMLAKLGIKKESFCRTPSLSEVHLEFSALLKLFLLYLSKKDLENAHCYLRSATEKLESLNNGKYLYPHLHALLKYHTIVIDIQSLMNVEPNSSVEFLICPSFKYCVAFSSRMSKSENSKLNFKTPPKKEKLPRIVITPCPDAKVICKAPIKKDVLPSYMKKDMQTYKSLEFSSSEEEVFSETPKKSDNRRILRHQKVSDSESHNIKKVSKCATYKLFKSKNTRLNIKSASDVWKCATLATPKSQKNIVKAESSLLTKRKTRSASTVKSNELLSPKSVSLKPKKSSKCKSKCEFYVDSFENIEEYSTEVNSSILGPKVSIEFTRSTSENRLNPTSRTTLEDNWINTEGLLPNENVSAPLGVVSQSSEFAVFDELCEDINHMNIKPDKISGDNVTTIPVENLKEFIAELYNIRLFVQHSAPYPIYVNICRLLGVLMLNEANSSKDQTKLLSSGFLLSETFATTLRHVHLNKLLFSKKTITGAFRSLAPQSLDTKFSMNSQMEYLLSTIPKDFTVVQICALSDKENNSHKKFSAPKLLISRYQQDSKPLTMCVDSTSNQRFNSCVFSEFDTLMTESSVTMKKDHNDTRMWWKTRITLDSRLRTLTKNMEEMWLGCWKGLLLSIPISKQRKQKLTKIADTLSKLAKPLDMNLLQVFLDSVPFLKREQISAAICQIWDCNPFDTVYAGLFKTIWESALVLPETERHPLILILDKNLQSFPWESLPLLEDVPVSRMPSLSLMSSKLVMLEDNSVFQKGCDSNNTFYILNPDGDLKYSQEYFQPRFEKYTNWKGITGRLPAAGECISAIKDYDLFIYCGHGSGRQYLGRTPVDKLKCRATAILVGCSSGYLRPLGKDLEAYGFSLTYLMNGCPCVVGNLWDVTDKDIDRFADKFFEQFLPDYSEKEIEINNIAKAVSKGRKACRMRYLVGAAPVVYGLPVLAKNLS